MRLSHVLKLFSSWYIVQYKYNIDFAKVNIKSLEDVVRRYIALAEYKTEAARNESHQCVLDIDDLDQPDTPER